MIVQTHFPQKLSSKRYDQFLASGWFRGSVMLYKMDVLCLESDIYSVVNIRLNLEKHVLKRSLKKIKRRGLDAFKVTIGPVHISAEKERLYALQKPKFQGFIHNTLYDFLYSGFRFSVFDTQEVCVYKDDELVACSYFDLGEKSMASLLGIYDPDYSSYSLGIFTMLMELQYGKDNGYKWYYPGYILNEDKGFEYKLRLGNYEYYNSKKRWAAFSKFDQTEVMAHHVKLRNSELEEALHSKSITFRKWTYPYFGIGYMHVWDMNFMRLPMVYELASDEDKRLFLGLDLDHKRFKLMWCEHAKGQEHMVNMALSDGMKKNEHVLLKLYKQLDLVMESEQIMDIADYLSNDGA
ncbi:MAG: hypothetical protein AB8B53_11225 [Flavobacteriales bacterium]